MLQKNQRKSFKYITEQCKNNTKLKKTLNTVSETKVRLRKYIKATRHEVFNNHINCWTASSS